MPTTQRKCIYGGLTLDVARHYIGNVTATTPGKRRNGKCRVILNLKRLNDCVEYHHFKMETLKSAVNLVTKGRFMASIDLQDTYYSCKIRSEVRKFLRCLWKDQKYQYACLAMGLASSRRIFTKLMKPVFATLRKQGYTNIANIDDTLFICQSEEECINNIKATAT